MPRVSTEKIVSGKYLNNWEVINIHAIRDVTIFSPIPQIGKEDGKKDDSDGKGKWIKSRYHGVALAEQENKSRNE